MDDLADLLDELPRLRLLWRRLLGEAKDDDEAAEDGEDLRGLGREKGRGPRRGVVDEVEPERDGGGVVARLEGEVVGDAREGAFFGDWFRAREVCDSSLAYINYI